MNIGMGENSGPNITGPKMEQSPKLGRRTHAPVFPSVKIEDLSPKIIMKSFDYITQDGVLFKANEFGGDFKNGQELGIIGEVFHKGQEVGEFTRTIHMENGSLVVTHLNFDITEPSLRGRGIAKEWLEHCEGAYGGIGVSEVRVFASQVGGYAWARAGYEWFEGDLPLEEARGLLMKEIEQNLKHALASQEISVDELEFIRNSLGRCLDKNGRIDIQMVADLDLPGWSKPVEPLSIDETQDRAMGRKSGKRERTLGQVILTDTSWTGRKFLSAKP